MTNHIDPLMQALERQTALSDELRAEYRCLLNAISAPIVILNRNLDLLYCNKSYADHFDKSVTDIERQSHAQNLSQMRLLYRLSMFDDVLETGQMTQHKTNQDGFYYRQRIYPTPNGGLLAIREEITDPKALKRQTAEIALERQRMSLLAAFVQDASQEFRSPLSIARSSLYLLQQLDDADKRQQMAQHIDEQLDQIHNLVESLVLMANLDSERTILRESVVLGAILSDLHTRFHSFAKTKNIHFTLDVPDDLPEIYGNTSRVFIALEKIVDNALRYTPENGQVEIAAWQLDDHESLCIAIKDNGVGISHSHLSRIFERFYRQNTPHQAPGFGLGLPIAQRIVALHGGQIEVDTVLGQGSTFRIVLPLKSAIKPQA